MAWGKTTVMISGENSKPGDLPAGSEKKPEEHVITHEVKVRVAAHSSSDITNMPPSGKTRQEIDSERNKGRVR